MPILQADAARIVAKELNIPSNNERENLYGLWPNLWPGGYEGVVDTAYPERELTLEVLLVALVRWNGWDTVDYDQELVPVVAGHVSPDGVPYYKFSPSPRSIPYVVAAIKHGLIAVEDVPRLQTLISAADTRFLVLKALSLHDMPLSPYPAPSPAPEDSLDGVTYPTHESRLAVLMPGFNDYKSLDKLPGRILDLAGPEVRLFNAGARLSHGRQAYLPLGPLETMFNVGLNVGSASLSHQAQAIMGSVDNHSSTVNAVGIWGQGTSWKHDARAWGGFFVAETAGGPECDAQIVGLEVDVINNTQSGKAPNPSKSGIQIVGLGNFPVSDAIQVIGAGEAKWENGLLFGQDAITEDGAYIAMSPSRPIARGIDMAGTRFTDAALAIAQQSAITMQVSTGVPAAIYTDENDYLVLKAGPNGVRFINDSAEVLLEITPDGDLKTRHGNISDLLRRLESLEARLS